MPDNAAAVGQNNGVDGAAQRGTVSVRLPAFIPSSPALWFALIERYFQTAGITSEAAKFSHAVLALDARYTVEIEDIILNPHATQPFTSLKETLIKRLSASQEKKTRELLEKTVIGDRKPSQFLRELRSLGGTVFRDDVIRTIWISRLPANMQAILATQQNQTLNQVADLADTIASTYKGNAQQLSEVSQEPSTFDTALNLKMTQLMLSFRQEMTETIRREISAMQPSGRSTGQDHTHARARSNSRGRSHSRNRQGNSELCWYHYRSGADAKNCKQPCSFSGNANGNR